MKYHNCDQWKYKCGNPRRLRLHMSHVHHIKFSSAPLLKCNECEFSTDDQPIFGQHNYMDLNINERREQT